MTRDVSLLCEALDRTEAELFNLYKTLEQNGIIVDQVDKDADGRDLWRWILRAPGNLQQSIERWRSPHEALNAVLTVLLGETESER